MNIGVIGIRGAWSTESLSTQLARKQAGGAVIELDEIGYDLERGTCHHPHFDLTTFDGFIVKKMGKQYSAHLPDQLSLLEMLERRGHAFFSRPAAIRKMISRLACTLQLREADIPMPPTFVTGSASEAAAWSMSRLPVIVKPLYSTKARGMLRLSDPATLQQDLERFLSKGEKVIYLQQQVDLSARDYGMVFLGGEFIGAYARVGDGKTWHTTTREGGRYTAYKPPQSYIELASRAQAPFGLDFTCVDLAESKEFGPIVFEVSAFGGYKGLHQASGIDASDRLTDYAISSLPERLRAGGDA